METRFFDFEIRFFDPEPGFLKFEIRYFSFESRPHQSVSAGALEVDQRETFYFFHYLEERRLKVGDVVTITVHASGSVPRIKPATKETKALRQRRYAAHSAGKTARR